MTALPDWFDENEFERLLREKYEPLCTPEQYAELRRRCGLGQLVEGQAVSAGQPSLPTATYPKAGGANV